MPFPWLLQHPTFTYEALIREFAALSEEEQQRIVRERYGLETSIEETPEFVSNKLQCFEATLDNIGNKEAYETALFVIPEHVESDQFRLAFLRADDFDEKAAATRMVKYWDRKVELFGADTAFKPYLSLLDFDEEDYKALVKGGIRLLPFRDEHGRAVLFNYTMYFERNSEAMYKLFWWVLHKGIFDTQGGIDTQKKGFIVLGGNPPRHITEFFGSDQSFWHEFNNTRKTLYKDWTSVLPLKTAAIHRFQTHVHSELLFEHGLRYMDLKLRSKIFMHDTNDMFNTVYLLLRCGVRPEIVPWELGGGLDFNYQHWVADCLEKDLQKAGMLTKGGDAVGDEALQKIPQLESIQELLTLYRLKEMQLRTSMMSQHTNLPS